MSELTSYNSEQIYWAVEQVEQEAGDIDDFNLDDNLFYLKSKADEVIAEKDKKIAELQADISDLRDDKKSTDAILDERNATIAKLIDIDSDNRSAYYKDLAMMAKDVAYQKYKRCLAMAWWCDAELYAYPSFGTESPKEKWWRKWRNRWLAIAEKFKEAK